MRKLFNRLFPAKRNTASMPDQQPVTYKVVLKSHYQRLYGQFGTSYTVELHANGECVKRHKCQQLAEAETLMAQIEANPLDHFHDTKIIDQVVFSSI